MIHLLNDCRAFCSERSDPVSVLFFVFHQIARREQQPLTSPPPLDPASISLLTGGDCFFLGKILTFKLLSKTSSSPSEPDL